MRAFAKHVLYATQRTGLPRVLHRTLFRRDVSILMYHAIVRAPLSVPDWCFLDERSFRRQVAYLKTHFDVVPLGEAVDRMRSRTIRRPTAVITFDDGFENNYTVAWPILREARMPATIFPVSDFIDSNETVWFCRLHRAISETARLECEWDDHRFDLSDALARSRASAAIQRRLKQRAQSSLLAELDVILRRLGDVAYRPVDEGSPYRMLSRKAIAEMSRSGLIEFGGHTRSHSILSLLSQSECRREIADSVAAVAEVTGRPCTLFAYPNGRAQDYDDQAIATVASCGIETAVTTIPRANDRETPALELGRYGIGASITMPAFEATVHHVLASLSPGS